VVRVVEQWHGIGIAALGSTAVYAVEGVDGGVWYATITSGGAASGFSPLRGQVIHGVGAVG